MKTQKPKAYYLFILAILLPTGCGKDVVSQLEIGQNEAGVVSKTASEAATVSVPHQLLRLCSLGMSRWSTFRVFEEAKNPVVAIYQVPNSSQWWRQGKPTFVSSSSLSGVSLATEKHTGTFSVPVSNSTGARRFIVVVCDAKNNTGNCFDAKLSQIPRNLGPGFSEFVVKGNTYSGESVKSYVNANRNHPDRSADPACDKSYL